MFSYRFTVCYYKFASHFFPDLVLSQIAIIEPITAITANKDINASIYYNFIILYPMYENI